MKSVCLLLLIFICSFAKSQSVSKEYWEKDIEYLAKELPKEHKNLFFKRSKKDFLSDLKNLESNLDSLTDFETGIKLQQIVASMGDSHTNVNVKPLFDKSKVLPLSLYWFKDGIYILSTSDRNKEILGDRLLSVNGFPVRVLMDSLKTLKTCDNMAVVKNSTPNMFASMQVLSFFGFADNTNVDLELEDEDHHIITYQIQPEYLNRKNGINYEPASIPLCYMNKKEWFSESYLPEDHLFYLQYNRCWSREIQIRNRERENADKMPSFQAFEDSVFKVLKSNEVRKLVFDMRFNGGGNSDQGTTFIEKLANFQKTHSDLELYVVVGRQTFSSAIINTMDFKRLTNALVVGEETSGKPNHYGEVRNFKLPNSGLMVGYSTKYFQFTDEDLNTIKPDVVIEACFDDFAKGIDPVLEWVKQQ